MAQIDVSELLSDPDFIDDISVISRTTSVDSLGQVSFSETTLATVGCVEPASGKAVMKLPEAMRVEDVSSFWFKGVITASAPGQYSSILVFRGTRYQVRSVSDFSNWGRGYTEGLCVVEVPCP